MKNKQFTTTGYTNRKLKWTDLFKGGIISINKDLCECNEVEVQFCTADRYQNCKSKKQCDIHKPQCHVDRVQMAGKKYGSDITKKDKQKIKSILQRSFEKCRKIQITVQEEKEKSK